MINEFVFIEKKYPDFFTFYNESKDLIYHKFIEVFEELKDRKDGNAKITIIVGNVEGRPFQSDFVIEKSKPNILIETINPFFESIEDYETCDKIHRLYNQLTKN
jgi:hypothetical protein